MIRETVLLVGLETMTRLEPYVRLFVYLEKKIRFFLILIVMYRLSPYLVLGQQQQ